MQNLQLSTLTAKQLSLIHHIYIPPSLKNLVKQKTPPPLLKKKVHYKKNQYLFTLGFVSWRSFSMKEDLSRKWKIKWGLILNFDSSNSLLSKVKNVHTQNKADSEVVSILARRVYDYKGIMSLELFWLS